MNKLILEKTVTELRSEEIDVLFNYTVGRLTSSFFPGCRTFYFSKNPHARGLAGKGGGGGGGGTLAIE